MSNGREFQRTEAATGNERRPTVSVLLSGNSPPSNLYDVAVIAGFVIYICKVGSKAIIAVYANK